MRVEEVGELERMASFNVLCFGKLSGNVVLCGGGHQNMKRQRHTHTNTHTEA